MFYTLPNRNILSYLDPSQKPELGFATSLLIAIFRKLLS
jgi:hypothetical protein